jgi:hypothetical protein
MRRSPAPSTIITQKNARSPKASDFLKSRSIAYCVSAYHSRQPTRPVKRQTPICYTGCANQQGIHHANDNALVWNRI